MGFLINFFLIFFFLHGEYLGRVTFIFAISKGKFASKQNHHTPHFGPEGVLMEKSQSPDSGQAAPRGVWGCVGAPGGVSAQHSPRQRALPRADEIGADTLRIKNNFSAFVSVLLHQRQRGKRPFVLSPAAREGRGFKDVATELSCPPPQTNLEKKKGGVEEKKKERKRKKNRKIL